MPRKRDEEDRKRREKLARASLKRVRALDADLSRRSAAAVRAIPEGEWERAERTGGETEEAGKEGPGRGWWGPPRGTHGKQLPSAKMADWYRATKPDQSTVEALDKMGPWEAHSAAEELGLGPVFRQFSRDNRRWTQGADSEAKEDIAGWLRDPQVKTLSLYGDWSTSRSDLSFAKWLNTPQTYYRGGRRSYPFMSFTTSERAARDASKSDFIWSVRTTPASLMGSGMTGAGEVYIDSDAIEQIPMGESAALSESRDWHPLVAEMSDVQKLVHLAARWDSVDEQQWRAEILRTAKDAYEDELTIQAVRAGCPGRRGLLTNGPILSELGDAASGDAASVVNTFDYDLAIAIRHIRSEVPAANRYVYAKRIADWAAARAEWKDPQINQMTIGKTRALAQGHFITYNGSQGTARLEPRQAVCPVCQGWINRGNVPLHVAMNNPGPWHPGCPHGWNISYEGARDCDLLWMGE